MTSHDQLFAGLYVAWAILALASVPLQKNASGRTAAILAAGGLGVLLLNLFLQGTPWHLVLRITAWTILGYAMVLTWKVRFAQTDSGAC